MRLRALTAIVACLVLGLSAGVAVAGTETLKGEFVWNNENQTGDLEAVFTETGKNTWDVAFHFMWEDQPRVWKGTAAGNLKKGTLKGEVVSDGERQSTFVFEGKFKKGEFSGTHAAMRDGERRDTGTLTLGR